MLGHLSAIVTFLLGVVLSVAIARPLKAWPSWPLPWRWHQAWCPELKYL
jgi:hypothetical protein